MKKGNLLSILLFISTLNYSQTFITGKIYNSETISLFGNVNLKNTNIQNPESLLNINSNNEKNDVTLDNSSVMGTVNIEGNDQTVFHLSNNCVFESLKVDKQDYGDLELDGESLTVEKNLDLLNGGIKTNDAIFRFSNPDPNSISYNDFSYIIGKFYRKTTKNIEYPIPVGDEEHLHLVKLTDLDSDQNIFECSFHEGLPDELSKPQIQLSNHGYWELIAQNKTLCNLIFFYQGMNLSDQDKPSILQLIKDESNYNNEFFLEPLSTNHNELCFTIKVNMTEQASKLVIVENQEEELDRWINFISLSSGLDTHFIISGLNIQYTDISMTIYNNWGNKIFKTINYQNEFDARGYPEGTYYYHADYTKISNGKRVLKNGFFEIKK